MITRSDAVAEDRLLALRERLRRLAPGAGVHLAIHEPLEFVDQAGQSQPLAAIRGRDVLAFCGIGNPGHFFDSLESLGARLIARRPLDDHVAYTPDVIESLAALAAGSVADICVTTQKDFVKLTGVELPLPVWRLAVGIKLVEGEGELIEKILAAGR